MSGRYLAVALLVAGLIGSSAPACTEGAALADRDGAASAPDAGRVEPSPPPHAHVPSAKEGRDLLDKLECNRCHAGTGQAEVAQAKHCYSCHVDIAVGKAPKSSPDAPAPSKAVLAKWKPRVEHLRFVPSLSGAGTILRPRWIESYLVKPFDLRPGLHGDMPRLPLAEPEARSIAAYFAERAGGAEAEAPFLAGDIERGRGYFSTKGCSGCHTFTGARTASPPAVTPRDGPDRALAPDLRYARDRVRTDRLVDWILDPRSIKPDAAMLPQKLTREEATDLAAFVVRAPLDDPPARAKLARLPVLERPVTYDEVAEKVLHKICWHCHSQPDFARGDGGPGNTGGFGFEGRKLDLSSYESIAGGYLDAGGKRRSVFAPAPNGEPMLLSVLLERAREVEGTMSPVRGMPLGLPPLSPEDVQIVETWIAQGHPR